MLNKDLDTKWFWYHFINGKFEIYKNINYE